MRKFKHLWIIVAALLPLIASKVNAQSFGAPIDILGPVQEDLIREVRQQPRQTDPIPSANPAPSVDNSVERGVQLYYKGNYQGALIAFNRAVSMNPNDATVYILRSAALNALNDYQGALEDANRAIRIDSSLAGGYFVRSHALRALRDYQGALEDANRAIRINSGLSNSYIVRSLALRALRDYQGALEDANRVIRIKPTIGDGYFLRSNAFLGLGDGQSALEDANQAVKLEQATNGRNLPAFYGLRSIVHYELGNVDAAMSDARTAVALDSESAEAMLGFAVLLYTKGDRQESLRLAEKAIRLDGNVADLKYLKEMGWGKRLLADTQNFFTAPQMKGILSAANTGSSTQEIIGVGIQLKQEPKTKQLIVDNTITGSSAAAAGILPLDVVTKIDNLSTNAMSVEQAVKLIRGDAETVVKIGILRDGKQLEFSLKRTRLVVQSK